MPDIQEFESAALPHMNALYQSARALLRSATDADDAVQETFLQAWKSFDRFTIGTNCRAWMFSILFNVVRHQRRKWLFRVNLVEDPQELERTLAYSEPVTEILRDEEMLEALRQIPQQQAEVVLLADVHELAYKEIQEALGIPIGTVMSRLSRGRLALRGKLTDAARRMGIGEETHTPMRVQRA